MASNEEQQQQDFTNLEAWKNSQQRTIELIIGLLPRDQQELQRQQLQLIQKLQNLPLELQMRLVSEASMGRLPQSQTPTQGLTTSKGPSFSQPMPTLEGVVARGSRTGLSKGAISSPSRANGPTLSAEFSSLKSELSFLENLQKLLAMKATPQQQVDQLAQSYVQFQNLQQQTVANTTPKQSVVRAVSRSENKENQEFVSEQMRRYHLDEHNFVARRDTHYRIKPPHGKHCYCVCKQCNEVFTTRHFKKHYQTKHEAIASDASSSPSPPGSAQSSPSTPDLSQLLSPQQHTEDDEGLLGDENANSNEPNEGDP